MRIQRSSLLPFACLAICLTAFSADAADKAAADAASRFPAEHVQFFESEVLPILKRTCFKCHGGRTELEGGFRITSRAGILKGGESGPAVDLKQLDKSEFLAAIRYESFEMPPNAKLPDENIAVLTKWVKLGLPWSNVDDYGVPEAPHVAGDDEEGEYWAYQPIKRPELPAVKHQDWARNDIDRFVLAKVEGRGLTPTQPADKVALIRRAYYDLTGLPPTALSTLRMLADAVLSSTRKR